MTHLPGVTPWFDALLNCLACGKRTYRPPGSRRPCSWCGGKLTEDGKLLPLTLDNA